MKLGLFPVLTLLAASLPACGAPVENDADAVSSESGLAVSPKLEAAVATNLQRLEKEIGASHLASYRGYGSLVGQFMWALDVEYGESPALLKRRAEVLAAPVYFSMPDVLPEDGVGRRTAFHGMDETAFTKLGANEDFVWSSHKAFNGGSKDGIRPFSVCETKFLIGIAKGAITGGYAANGYVSSFDPYAHAYADWAKPEAANCTQADRDEFFDYRGLGELRPSWLESNYEDRVLRRYATMCKDPPQEWWGRCGEYGAGRLRLRERKNRAMALRQMVYDPRPEAKIGGLTEEQYMTSPSNGVLLLEDRLGDGVAELVTPGPLDLLANARFELTHSTLGTRWVTASYDKKTLSVDGGPALAVTAANLAFAGTGSFTGELRATFAFGDGSTATASLPPRVIKAVVHTDPAWKSEYAGAPDMGLLRMFPDQNALLKRFASMLDRHESFYATYSSNDENDRTISSQPSPLVACSVTVNASRAWAWAGTPPGGRAGLVFLMRAPFKDILTADTRSIDTLGRLGADPLHDGPKVLTLAKAYAEGSLDMSRVWLDLATLSNDLYSTENEVSKFGAVPAEQIEGILVIGKPGALP
jgi:hypothetical protein